MTSSGGGAIRSLNGTTVQQANDDYWSTGVRNKTYIAKAIAGEGGYASRETYANNYAKSMEKSNQAVIDKYNNNPTNYTKSHYDYVMRTRKSTEEYRQEGGREYDRIRQDALNMASADVAKRMGYNISGSRGDHSASALNSVMGKSNADALRASVVRNARQFLDSRRRRR